MDKITTGYHENPRRQFRWLAYIGAVVDVP